MASFVRSVLAAVVVGGVCAGCGTGGVGSSTSVPTPNTSVEVDQEFSLAIGQAATVASLGLTVRFDAVTADSRCPARVVCVWAGDGAVRLTIVRGSAAAREATLHTMLDPKKLVDTDYSVSLVSLDPPKLVSDPPISAKDYRVRLVVHTGS